MARDAGPPPGGAGQQDETQQTEAKKGGGLPLKLIIPVIAVLAGAGAGIALTVFVFVPRMQQPKETEVVETTPETELLVPLDQIMSNIATEYGTDFLVVDITLVCADKEAKKRVDANLARIYDALSAMLSAKTYEEVQGIVGREQLKRAVKDKLNGILGSGTISDVYVPSLVMQSM